MLVKDGNLLTGTIREIVEEMYCEAEGTVDDFDFNLKKFGEETREGGWFDFGACMIENPFSFTDPVVMLGVYGNAFAPTTICLMGKTVEEDINALVNIFVRYISYIDGTVTEDELIIAERM